MSILRKTEDIFKAAGPEDLEKRRADRVAELGRQHGALYARMEDISKKLGFGRMSRAAEESGRIELIARSNSHLNLRLRCETAYSPNRIMASVSSDRAYSWQRMFLSLKLTNDTIAKKIRETLLPRFESGDTGWKAIHLPKALYRKRCGMCGAPIKSGEEHMRLSSGQTVCKNCVKKSASLLQMVEDIFKPADEKEVGRRASIERDSVFKEMMSKCRYPIHDKIELQLSLLKDYIKANDRPNIIDTLATIWVEATNLDYKEGRDNAWQEQTKNLDRIAKLTPKESLELDKVANKKAGIKESNETFKAADPTEVGRRREEYDAMLPKTYKEWGRKEGMSEEMADAFDKYMTARWGDEHLNDGYGEEWLIRFKRHNAWSDSDGGGRKILKQIGYYDGPHKW